MRQVTHREAQELAQTFGMQYFDTSAKTDKNVTEMMNHLCELTYTKKKVKEEIKRKSSVHLKDGGIRE